MEFIEKFIDIKVLFEYNSVLTLGLLVFLAISISIFKETPLIVSVLNLITFSLFLSVFYRGNKDNRVKIGLAMIIFGLYGIITESLVISNTKVLEYSFPDKEMGLNYPSYLFFIYASWVLVINLIFKLVKYI
jgi:hypothetical protein